MHIPSFVVSAEKLIQDNAPTILTGVGVVGTVATAVLAGKAGWQSVVRITELANPVRSSETHEIVQQTEVPTKDKLKAVLPLYIPAIAVGGTTITCIVFAHKISASRLAGMAAVYALSEGKLKDYKTKVEELMGVEKKNEVEDAVAVDRVRKEPKVLIVTDGQGKGLYYDSYSARSFWATRTELDAAQNAVMLEVINNGRCDLNKWFNEVGLEETGYGETVGWSKNTPFEFHIRPSMDTDDRPMAYVDYDTEPIGRYNHQ